MIYPIVAYGDVVLRQVGEKIDKNYPELAELIASMFETMKHANGVGLAAPQIGLAIRLFVIDSHPMFEEMDDDDPLKEEGEPLRKVFINAEKIAETGKELVYAEGCLSIPGVSEDVVRPDTLRLRYFDENFKQHEETFTGLNARVIQHEYDHIEGVLFIDYLKPLKKRLLRRRLEKISKGEIPTRYRMRLPK
ncbi:MAG: peptide deformylase [Chitinophagales bacterium]|nr:peptide deformylase [Bacteroidota bacterium]